MMMPHRLTALLIACIGLACGSSAQAQPAAPAPAPPAQPEELLPRPALEKLYAAELSKYDPAQYDSLYAAHLLLERYFLATSAEDRTTILKALDNTGLDPTTLGRMCRIRLGWAAIPAGVAFIREGAGAHEVQYFVGIPKDYDRTKSWPLVIRLPAVNALITDPEKMPTQDDVVKMYSDWIADELARHPDAIVLMPRLNLDELYGPSLKGMSTVIQPMHHVAGKLNIDHARVYLSGHGMGAHAVWNLGLHYTTFFAALNPMAGAASQDWQRVRLLNLKNLLVYAWADTTDKIIPSGHTGALVSVLKNFKYDVVLEQTRNLGHLPAPEIVEKGYKALRDRTRDLYPKQVNIRSTRPDPTFNRVDWLQVDQPLIAGAEKRIMLRKGTGPIVVNENTHTVQASLTGPNKIEAKTDNVRTLRFYLNDQMMDLTKPVTIIVNGKTRFEGMPKPSLEEMLRDQLYLGRGWRYFTAILDIDLAPPATRPATTRSTTAPVIPAFNPTSPTGQFYFTIDDGKTWFPAPATTKAPFQHEGKSALRAHLYSTDGGKTFFVGFISKFSPIAGEMMVRRQGSLIWTPMSAPAAGDMMTVKAPAPIAGKPPIEMFPPAPAN